MPRRVDHDVGRARCKTAPMALLERDRSLAELAAMFDEVRAAAEGRLVLVAGEAGVGKTAVLRRFGDGLPKPTRLLWGACEPLRTPRPLGPFLDIAEETGGELEQVAAGAPRPHEVASALMRELRGQVPTVVVIEDAHWADEATLDVLTLLVSRIAAAPALVIASYRDDELDRDGQLRFVLGELVRRTTRIRIEPLSQSAVAGLADPYGIDGSELHRTTQGNPFFVHEVLAAGGERIPETVRDAVLARAAGLSAPARRLLETIAVIPGATELWLLEELGGTDLGELDDCLASGMLDAERMHVAFRHELARLAIEDAITPRRRVALHRQALAALAERGSDFAALAHHAEAAADRDAVLRWAPRAAVQAASSGAHREAAEHYGRALRFADGAPAELRADLLQAHADECYVTAQFETAIDALRDELTYRRALGDRRGEGNALRALARVLFFSGRTEEAEPVARDAVELLEALPAGHELAMAYNTVSQRRMVVADDDAAIAWGARALALARELGDTEAEVYALTNIGAAEFQMPSGDEKTLERALALATQSGLEEYVGRAFLLLVHVALYKRDYGVVRRYLATGLDYCSARGLDTWRLYLEASRARLQLARGEWDEAADAATSVLHDPRSAQVARSWALATLGAIRARRGDSEVDILLDEAQKLVHRTGELDRIGHVAATRAEAAWLRGDAASVDQVTGPALALAVEQRLPWVVGELAHWRWWAGVRDELPPDALAEPYGLVIARHGVEAAARWRALGCPYEAALALAADGEPDAVRHAVEELQRLGARPAVAILSRRLRDQGARGVPRGPRRRTREHPAGLTAREVDVLRLLTEGLRNAEIADRLVVSTKTVDHHVSAILRKLGVHTRGEAVAEVTRRGLLSRT